MSMIHSISITKAAELKDCSRVTIYQNLEKFDLAPDGRVIPNAKFKKWTPYMSGGRITIFKKREKKLASKSKTA